MSDLENCIICGTKFQWEWTDFHGIAKCTTCGMIYDMKGFNGVKETVCSVKEGAMPTIKEYWEVTKEKMFFGHMVKPTDEEKVMHTKMIEWVREHHPEELNK